MDHQTGLIYVGIVVISAAIILLISTFGIKEKSYEEAIAEQRKLPDDLLLGKKDKSKDKKHKSKTGKKVKEKKEEKDDKDDKPEHVQFEETPQILSPETNAQEANRGNKKKIKPEKVKPILLNKDESPVIMSEPNALQSPLVEVNHFDVIQPKDDLELVRSQSKENLHQVIQSELVISKSPKGTPTKSKKNAVKEPVKKKEEIKEEKKEVVSVTTVVQSSPKDSSKESKESQKDVQKESPTLSALPSKETNKKNKKKIDILSQIGGDKDGVNISLLMPLVKKAELSRSEIQILIDLLLNKQLDNPMEHSEWTEGRADQLIKLKKQLAEKEKALAEEHEANVTVQNKVKELRAELNSERSRSSARLSQLEEALAAKTTEVTTLQTRMQHILETNAAEKQGLTRQIEHLQVKSNEDDAIIRKIQEDSGQTHGHIQQELIAQRKQFDVQFAQMRDTENALKAEIAQKHVEFQQLQNVNMSLNDELQATCELQARSNADIEMLQQQLAISRDQLIHAQEMARQFEESRRDYDHRLKNAHRHEQELQKQIHSLQAELKMSKSEASELNAELTKAQSELTKLKSDASEVMNLRGLLNSKDEELKKVQTEMAQYHQDLIKAQAEVKKLQNALNESQNESSKGQTELAKIREELKHEKNELSKSYSDIKMLKDKLAQAEDKLSKTQAFEELKLSKSEQEQLQNGDKSTSNTQLLISKLQEDKDRLVAQLDNFSEMQKEVKRLREENEVLLSKLNTTDGRENGVNEKSQKNTVQELEQSNLLAQKDKQLETLQTEIMKRQKEFNELNAQIEILQRDANNQNNLTKRLQEDLEAQRLKNDELRTKNWKVMEALSAAESRIKSNSRENIDEHINKAKMTEQEATKSLLQRIFPEINIAEKSYDKWLKTFEERVHNILTEKKSIVTVDNSEMEKQNKNLQGMVAHYKQIIMETESMLNNLQNYVESEESRWKADLRQKENEVINLKVELQELRSKTTLHDKTHQDTDGVEFAFNCIEKSLPTITRELQEKISQLELRLKEDKEQPEQKADLVRVTSTHTSPIKSVNFVNIEQLEQEKQRLSQDLETERNKNASLNAELNKIQSLIAQSEKTMELEKTLVSQLQNVVNQKNRTSGAGSSVDQCAINGPPATDSSNSTQKRSTHSLLAAIENPLVKKSETENRSITSTNLVESVQQIDRDSFTSLLNSDNCHTTDNYDTKAQWHPMNCQQQKKHKKKRKGGSGKK
ncbi:ribosome-binding protein 1 isoform X3 [Chelonus insularis]|uniref:ribosome-binding protein 1 isoform X3 n=1 Tax=Chelonus insularis TaxID=460826 RepID=UPI00158E06D3|nr:ribosome-binding protein 1 isoform X3 [Chelonus insularis]